MPFQPSVAHHIPVGAPAAYWYPVTNSSAPRVGWFVDDGTCHGELALGGYTNAFGGDLPAGDHGLSEGALSDNEEDVVMPELTVGAPERLALEEAPRALAILTDKSNVIAVAPATANKTQLPASKMTQDVRHQIDCGRAAASQQGGDENAPSASPASLPSIADVLALCGRLGTTPVSPAALPQPPAPGMAEPSQSPAVDAADHIIVKPHAHRCLGYAKRW